VRACTHYCCAVRERCVRSAASPRTSFSENIKVWCGV
jgi:hypothetical protein